MLSLDGLFRVCLQLCCLLRSSRRMRRRVSRGRRSRRLAPSHLLDTCTLEASMMASFASIVTLLINAALLTICGALPLRGVGRGRRSRRLAPSHLLETATSEASILAAFASMVARMVAFSFCLSLRVDLTTCGASPLRGVSRGRRSRRLAPSHLLVIDTLEASILAAFASMVVVLIILILICLTTCGASPLRGVSRGRRSRRLAPSHLLVMITLEASILAAFASMVVMLLVLVFGKTTCGASPLGPAIITTTCTSTSRQSVSMATILPIIQIRLWTRANSSAATR